MKGNGAIREMEAASPTLTPYALPPTPYRPPPQERGDLEKEVKSLEERISGAKAIAMGDAGEEERERLAQIEQVQSDIQARSNE